MSQSHPRLKGQTAIVTGGSAGIGFDTCLALAREGARLVIVGRDSARLAEAVRAVAEISTRGTPPPISMSLDVRSDSDMRRMAAETIESCGRIDILVHAAGILRPPGARLRMLAKMPTEDWDAVLQTNLRGTFLANRAVVPSMIRQRSGNIVNLSSLSGRVGLAFDAPYCASKFGVIGLSESLADEVRGHGVRVQSLLPGMFQGGVWNQSGLPAPKDLPPASRVAETIVQLVALPDDVSLGTQIVEPLVNQVHSGWRGIKAGAARGRRTAGKPAESQSTSTAANGAATEQRAMSSFSSAEVCLTDKVIVVTGGTGGIGLSTAQAVVADGGSVVICDVNADRLAECVDAVAQDSSPGQVHGIQVDVRNEEDARRMTAETLDRFGRIDGLVAAAGILRKPGTPPKQLTKVTCDEWDQVIETNLKGIFLTNRAVLPTMIAQRSGTVINISSVSGLRGRAHDGPYCASKFGVIGLTQSVADEVRGYGVKVMSVLPDAIDTPMWQQNHPIPPPSDSLPPQRVAELIVYLLKQPADTILVGPVIAPLGARTRRPAETAAAQQ